MQGIFTFNRSISPDLWYRFAVQPYHVRNTSITKTVTYTANSVCPSLFDKKLTRLKHHLPDQVWIGNGCDPYPAIERKNRLTRRLLEIAAKYSCSVLLSTRSPLILRDIDIIAEIASLSHATIMISIPGFSQKTVSALEPYAPSLANRVLTIKRLKRSAVYTGIAFMPLVAGINDDSRNLRRLFRWSAENYIDFIYFPDLAFSGTIRSKKGDTALLDLYKPVSEDLHQLQLERKLNQRYKYLSRLILELALEFKISLRINRFLPEDNRRENYWLANRLTDLAFYRQMAGKSFKPFLKSARKLNYLDMDIRNIIRQGTLFEQSWMEKSIMPAISDFLEGKWAGRDYEWEWIRESLQRS